MMGINVWQQRLHKLTQEGENSSIIEGTRVAVWVELELIFTLFPNR